MQHSPIVILLEQKQQRSEESEATFAARLFSNLQPNSALALYRHITHGQQDFPERYIESAAAILELDAEQLRLM